MSYLHTIKTISEKHEFNAYDLFNDKSRARSRLRALGLAHVLEGAQHKNCLVNKRFIN